MYLPRLICAFSPLLASATVFVSATFGPVSYERVTHHSQPNHALRVHQPQLCDDTVQQQAGYLDVSDEKHFFFWFFESRDSPSTDPVILWLNGGPGCTSLTGLFFGLGPCHVISNGTSTTPNAYSWNSNANIIFLDQPVNVGYSYGNRTVRNTPVAATDVHAFLQLFFHRFPQYAALPFHIATESYGGVYVPHIAAVIHQQNKQLAYAPSSHITRINLHSIMLGNGLTDPVIQMPSIVDYACEGPFAIFEPYGERCYEKDTGEECMPAAVFCWQMLFGPLEHTGLNVYDVRQKCDPAASGPTCYPELPWIDIYMNRADVKEQLGVPSALSFTGCNMRVNTEFLFQGDGMRNTALLLTGLVDQGVRLLVFAGNADAMCNYMGEERWLMALPSSYQSEFKNSSLLIWKTLNGTQAGVGRTAGGDGVRAGNVTYLTVFEAGHIVAHDQPAAALDMVNRWVRDRPLFD